MSSNFILGNRIQELRKDMGITQQQMADKLNITKGAVSGYEIGRREPSNDILIKIANILGTSTDYLLGETNIVEKKQKKELSDVTQVSYNDLDDPQAAMEFILKQPTMMAFGGYRLDLMEEEEIVEFAQQMLSLMKLAAERYKSKK